MMTAIGGIAIAALLFGLFAALRPNDRSGKVGCTGNCGACTNAIKSTVTKVEGVKGTTIGAKTTTFEVTGDFDAEAVVKALNAAGFHVKVKN